MKTATKLSLLAGLAAGYVLGARAGRERYEQIATQANKVWSSAPVQKQAEKVQALADRYVPKAVEGGFSVLGKGASALTKFATGASKRESQRNAAARDTVPAPEGTAPNPA